MANPHPKTDHLKPWKPGQSGNPKGPAKKPVNRVEDTWLPLLFGKKRARELMGMTDAEINAWERSVMSMTKPELDKSAKDETIPSYAVGLAKAKLQDIKKGRTNTDDKLRERQYGKTVQKVELTGADGQSLTPAPLSIEIIDSRDKVDTDDGQDSDQ